MINKVPGRRGGAPSSATPEAMRLTISGPEIGPVKAELVAVVKRFNIGHATVTGEAEVTVIIDPRSFPLSPIYARGLKVSPLVAKESGVSADGLTEVRAQVCALDVLQRALEGLRRRLIGSRLIVAAAQGRLWKGLVSDLQRDLSDERISVDERRKLKSDASEVMAQVEMEGAQQQGRLSEQQKSRKAAAAQVAEATTRRRQLRALLTLQDDGEVDPEMLDQLASIYEQKVRVPEKDQRKSTR